MAVRIHATLTHTLQGCRKKQWARLCCPILPRMKLGCRNSEWKLHRLHSSISTVHGTPLMSMPDDSNAYAIETPPLRLQSSFSRRRLSCILQHLLQQKVQKWIRTIHRKHLNKVSILRRGRCCRQQSLFPRSKLGDLSKREHQKNKRNGTCQDSNLGPLAFDVFRQP